MKTYCRLWLQTHVKKCEDARRYGRVPRNGDVIDEINRCPEQVKVDFAELLDRLVIDPRDPRIGVLRLVDLSWPGEGYTVPFGPGERALLFYSLTADIPTIRLQAIIWEGWPPY
jgi:hypothetical protein